MIETRPHTERLSDRARVQRIAALLCKAIMRLEAQQAVSGALLQIPVATLVSGVDDDDVSADDRIVSYLRFVDSASPATIRESLGLSRSTAHRALSRLTRRGSVVCSGQTRTLAYRLSVTAPCPEKLALN